MRTEARDLRIVVVGAQGTLGGFVAGALEKRGWDVLRAGRRLDGGTPGTAYVDLDQPETLAEVLPTSDLVINCVQHRPLTAERLILNRGSALLNVAALPVSQRAVLERWATEGNPRGLVVVHAGLNPGLSTLALKQLLAEYPEADAVELVMTASVREASGRQGTSDFIEWLTRRARHPVRQVALLPPYGQRRCLEVASDEEGLFGKAAQGRAAHHCLCFRERWFQALLLALNAAGVFKLAPGGAFAKRGEAPTELTLEAKRDSVAVLKGGERLGAISIEGEGDYRITVAATVAFAELMIELRSSRPQLTGVFSAEELFDLSDLAPRLAPHGLRATRMR
jgi:hypothetical protein